jgi:Sulfotransferase domain
MVGPRWNLSSRGGVLSGADLLVISVPKSGRTWVRAFLCAYFCRLRGYDFTLQPEQYDDPAIPRVIYSHDIFEHRTKGSLWDRLRGKYLVPARELRRAKILLLARDPRDTFVSLYLQLTRRDAGTRQAFAGKSISEVLSDRHFGIASIVATMNEWLEEFSRRPDFWLLRYESLRADPAEQFHELLRLLGHSDPDMSVFQAALEFSAFENMQRLEAAGAFDSKILRARDVADPESFKVRRGKVGGYSDYLSLQDREYDAAVMKTLDPRFGYATNIGAATDVGCLLKR